MVVNLINGMRLVATGKRLEPETKLLLTLMPSPLLQKSLPVIGVHESLQFSDVTPDMVWSSDKENLVLTDTALGDSVEKELIYTDKEEKTNKHFNNMKTITRLNTVTMHVVTMVILFYPLSDTTGEFVVHALCLCLWYRSGT